MDDGSCCGGGVKVKDNNVAKKEKPNLKGLISNDHAPTTPWSKYGDKKIKKKKINK